MSNAEWDDEDFEPEVKVQAKVTDKWDGEDEDDDVKDAWDEDDDAPKPEGSAVQNVVKKKKKSLKEIIAAKEGKKQQEVEERRKKEEEARRKLTPEEILEEKLRQQKIQEDADLELAKQAFGVTDRSGGAAAGGMSLDTFEPITKEDFDKYCGLLQERFTKLERSTHYVNFLEMLYRELAITLDVEDVKRLGGCLTAVYNEKNKAAKNVKGKKKAKGKANLNPGQDNNYSDYTTGAFDDLDDFM